MLDSLRTGMAHPLGWSRSHSQEIRPGTWAGVSLVKLCAKRLDIYFKKRVSTKSSGRVADDWGKSLFAGSRTAAIPCRSM